MYPLLQENSQVCPGKLEQGSRLPCGGAYSCWQRFSTKRNWTRIFFFQTSNWFEFHSAFVEIKNTQLIERAPKLRRNWKKPKKITSYSRQYSQNAAGASLNDEGIVNARIRHFITCFHILWQFQYCIIISEKLPILPFSVLAHLSAVNGCTQRLTFPNNFKT